MADLAQCQRCQAFTLVDKSGPVVVAVEIGPLARDQYIAALMAGVSLYDVVRAPQRPVRLRVRSLESPGPRFAPAGAQEAADGLVHAEHGCPASSQKVVKTVKPSEANVCDTWRATGWVPPPGKCPRVRGITSIKSCPECDAPPFASPLLAGSINMQTGGSQEGRDDQIREDGGRHGPNPDGPDGHPAPGGAVVVDRQPWVRPDVGRPGEAPAPLGAGPGGGRLTDRRPHQPQHLGQPSQQPAGGHALGIEPESGRANLEVGAGNSTTEVRPLPGDDQAVGAGVPAGDVRLNGGGGGGSGGIPVGAVYARKGSRAARQSAAYASERNMEEVSDVQSAKVSYPVCGTCQRNIKAGEMYSGAQHGPKWIWAEHEEGQCP